MTKEDKMDWLAFIPLHAIHIQHFNYFLSPRILFYISKLNIYLNSIILLYQIKNIIFIIKLVGKNSFRDHKRNIRYKMINFIILQNYIGKISDIS